MGCPRTGNRLDRESVRAAQQRDVLTKSVDLTAEGSGGVSGLFLMTHMSGCWGRERTHTQIWLPSLISHLCKQSAF